MTNEPDGWPYQPLELLLHEMRTSLAAIRGWAELPFQGLDDDDPELMVRALQRIHDEAERMYQGIQRAFPRSAASPVLTPRQVESVDLGEIIDQVVTSLGVLDPGREITRETSGNTTLVTDPPVLQHIVRNLLGNALQHTPNGTPVAMTVRGGAAGVELTISDHGPGMPPSLVAWLSTPEQHGAGGGLGLQFVKSAVCLLGGQITAVSDPARGTTIAVTLPSEGRGSPGHGVTPGATGRDERPPGP